MHIKNFLRGLVKNNLPPQAYYSLEELLVRWERDKVNFQKILEWVERGEFIMGVRVRSEANLYERHKNLMGDIRTVSKSTWFLEGDAPPALQMEYLDSETLVRILTAKPGVSVGATSIFLTRNRTDSSKINRGTTANYHDKSELFACTEEVALIEKKFKIGEARPALLKFFFRLNNLVPLATLVSVIYLITMSSAVMSKREEFHGLQLNALGDFLAGACAPMALLWLVVGFKIQARATDKAEQDLIKATKKQEESLELLKKQAESAVAQLVLERDKVDCQNDPKFFVEKGAAISESGNRVIQELTITNLGAPVGQVKLSLDDNLRELLNQGKTGIKAIMKYEDKSVISLVVKKNANPRSGLLKLNFETSDGRLGAYQLQMRIVPAKSAEPHVMPTIEFDVI